MFYCIKGLLHTHRQNAVQFILVQGCRALAQTDPDPLFVEGKTVHLKMSGLRNSRSFWPEGRPRYPICREIAGAVVKSHNCNTKHATIPEQQRWEGQKRSQLKLSYQASSRIIVKSMTQQERTMEAPPTVARPRQTQEGLSGHWMNKKRIWLMVEGKKK